MFNKMHAEELMTGVSYIRCVTFAPKSVTFELVTCARQLVCFFVVVLFKQSVLNDLTHPLYNVASFQSQQNQR